MIVHFVKVDSFDNLDWEHAYAFCSSWDDLKNIPQESRLLNSQNDRNFLEEKNDLLNNLRKINNNNDIFLSSPLACENTWQSDFFLGFEHFCQLQQVLKNHETITVFFRDPAWYLSAYSFFKKDSDCKIVVSLKDVICAHLKNISFQISRIYRVYQSLRSLISLSMPQSKYLKKIKDDYDVLFLSVWSKNALKKFLKEEEDPYFGDLPHHLIKKGKKTAIFCHINNFEKKDLVDFHSIKNIDVYSYFSCLSWYDILVIITQLFLFSFTVPRKFSFLKKALQKDLDAKIGIQSCHALMIKRSLTKLLKKKTQIIHMYEGNCWEKGCVMAARDVVGDFSTIGYQHTSFSRSFYKMKGGHPLDSDVIFSTGKLAKKVLEEFGHAASKTYVACALRQSLIYDKNPKKKFPQTIKNALVLLQGSPFDDLLLIRLKDLQKKNNLHITVRQHPAHKIDSKNMVSSFTLSQESDVYQDILSADIVFYHGTTAAWESCFLGVPSFFVDLGWGDDSDPLFLIKENLLVQKILFHDEISNLTSFFNEKEDLFNSHLSLVRDSFNDYFRRADDDAKHQFVKSICSLN